MKDICVYSQDENCICLEESDLKCKGTEEEQNKCATHVGYSDI